MFLPQFLRMELNYCFSLLKSRVNEKAAENTSVLFPPQIKGRLSVKSGSESV